MALTATPMLADGALAASAAGRGKMAAGFFGLVAAGAGLRLIATKAAANASGEFRIYYVKIV